MLHAEFPEVFLDARQNGGAGILVAEILGFGFGLLRQRRILFQHLAGDVADVIAVIPALGIFRIDHGQVADLAHAQIHGVAEQTHLTSGVVDVVLRGHIVAGKAQQSGQRVAHGGAASMSDVKRTGGIGGNVFHHDTTAVAVLRGAERLSLLFDVHNHLLPERRGEGDVDEAGTGRFHGNQTGEGGAQFLADLFSHDAGSGLGLLGKHQGKIGGKIAVSGVSGDFQNGLFRPFPAVSRHNVTEGLFNKKYVAHRYPSNASTASLLGM